MSAVTSHEIVQLGPGWYTEDSKQAVYGGEALSLKVREVLHHQKSEYQDILVLDR